MEARIQYAKTSDGVNIAYAVFGSGPPIVFPSNIWGNINLYKHQMGGFPGQYDGLVSLGWAVITYDSRGCGSSDRDVDDWSLEARLCDLEAVIERVAADRFAVCGTVGGGLASIAYSVQHPERVTHLVLSNAFARGADWYEIVPAMRASKEMSALAEDDWEFYTLSMASAITGHSDAELARRLAEAFRSGMTPGGYLAYRRAVEEMDITDLLPRIAVPTLVVHDRRFLAVRVAEVAKRLAPLIPDARFVETDDLAKTIDEFLREGDPAAKPAAAAEASAFRTILFTDVEGSTALTQRLGDARAREVLREHERITRECLKAHGGAEVKTMGDGFMASFGSAARALECAVAIQRAFAERGSEVGAHGHAPLRVRIGLNAGEPIAEDEDLFGTAVIAAARIAAQAQGGEILVSDVVRQLVAGKGFLFSGRGKTVLSGFDDPVEVYEVRWEEAE